MSYLNYARLFTALESSNPWNEDCRDSREAIVAPSISYLAIYLSTRLSCRSAPIQREKETLFSFFPLLFLFTSLSSSFLFWETIILDYLAFCRYCAFKRLLVTLCRCYGTICGFPCFFCIYGGPFCRDQKAEKHRKLTTTAKNCRSTAIRSRRSSVPSIGGVSLRCRFPLRESKRKEEVSSPFNGMCQTGKEIPTKMIF